MRTILVLLRKEFIQVFRNRTMLPIIFLLPVVQLVILVYAATFEMKNIKFCVVDHDLSQTSRELVTKLESSPFYTFPAQQSSVKQAMEQVDRDKADMILVLPPDFERKLVRNGSAEVQLLINAVNGNAASLIQGYTSAIIQDYNRNVRAKWINNFTSQPPSMVKVKARFWYNAVLDYKFYMLPGILVILVTVVGMFLSAFNLVREKEMGTIEQINVTPVKKYQFIVGKLVPFWLIALFELGFGLLIGKLFFNIPTVGSIGLIYLFASIYLVLALGFGLFLSTISDTQQQVMFMAWFFMLVFILMSGLFTPIEGMPVWAQKVNVINPFAYFIKVLRMVLIKGSGFMDLYREFLSMFIYGTLILSLAIWKYRKVS